MNQKVEIAFDFTEELVVTCNGIGCRKEKRIPIRRSKQSDGSVIKRPMYWPPDEEVWHRVVTEMGDGYEIAEYFCPECYKNYLEREGKQATQCHIEK